MREERAEADVGVKWISGLGEEVERHEAQLVLLIGRQFPGMIIRSFIFHYSLILLIIG